MTHSGSAPPCSWTTLNPSTLSEAAIMAELRARRTSFVQHAAGVPVLASRTETPNAAFAMFFFWARLGAFIESFCTRTAKNECTNEKASFAVHWAAVFASLMWVVASWLAAELVWATARRAVLAFKAARVRRAHYRGIGRPLSLEEFGEDGGDPEFDLLATSQR